MAKKTPNKNKQSQYHLTLYEPKPTTESSKNLTEVEFYKAVISKEY